jgi:hypothetical protein
MENRNDAPWRGWTRIRASGWFGDQLHSETYTLDLYDNYPAFSHRTPLTRMDGDRIGRPR